MLNLDPPPRRHISLTYIMGFDIKVIHQRVQTTLSHASRCHPCQCCNVDFARFHSVTHYASSLLSCIHVNTTYLLNITCILVTTSMLLGRSLECICNETALLHYNSGCRGCNLVAQFYYDYYSNKWTFH